MTLVIDASALVAALIERDAPGEWVETAIASQELAGPELVLAEATNILRRLEQRREVLPHEAAQAHRDLMRRRVDLFQFGPLADRIWELRDNLTSYDAWYVALAEALDCPLLTLDLRLSRAPGPTCAFVTPPDEG